MIIHSVLSDSLVLRPLTPSDNAALKNLIMDTLTEFGCIGPGFASSDPELEDLYSVYYGNHKNNESAYWVIVDEQSGKLLGGGGFSRLKKTSLDEAVCELQKVYFSAELRGKGFGRKLLELCMEEATRAGYREMYLETVPQMQNAVSLYQKFGFKLLPTYMGDTGHRGCTIFMSCPLVPIIASV
jgi:putative acetyltransferase